MLYDTRPVVLVGGGGGPGVQDTLALGQHVMKKSEIIHKNTPSFLEQAKIHPVHSNSLFPEVCTT